MMALVKEKRALSRAATEVRLPEPCRTGEVPLERSIQLRRSVRFFSEQSLTLAESGQLLWAAQGVTGTGGLRAVPSAGALYPLNTYAVAANVVGLTSGVYRYDPDRHVLTRSIRGDRREAIYRAANEQQCVLDAALMIALVAIYEGSRREFGDRGIRLAHMEAGHAGQNVCLQATALGLGVIGLGAFDDAAVREILQLEVREQPLYLLLAGHKLPL
jgi:SagB-type dehydrogenase family enzyme